MEKNLPYMISFSGGRTSAMMTHILLDQLKDEEVVVCFANTGKEEEATLEFVNNCDKLWDGRVVWLEYNYNIPKQEEMDPYFLIVDFDSASRKGEPFEALINRRGFTPNVVSRFCTQEMKVRVIKKYMQHLGYKEWFNVVGLRFQSSPLHDREGSFNNSFFHINKMFQVKQLNIFKLFKGMNRYNTQYRDWETDRKSTRLNSSHRSLSRMPSSA